MIPTAANGSPASILLLRAWMTTTSPWTCSRTAATLRRSVRFPATPLDTRFPTDELAKIPLDLCHSVLDTVRHLALYAYSSSPSSWFDAGKYGRFRHTRLPRLCCASPAALFVSFPHFHFGKGNGYCENGNNKAECNWDGGDCCSCDCQTDDPYACGATYNSFDCKNPASACFGEYVEPQTDDDWHTDDHFYTDDDDAMSYEFIDWSGAIEVGLLTEVGVSANAYDTRAGRSYGDTGCGEDGCVPAYTRDGNASEDESRWACASKLVDGEGPCQIEYTFAEPQDIVGIQVAFWKGNERTRTLEVSMKVFVAEGRECGPHNLRSTRKPRGFFRTVKLAPHTTHAYTLYQ